MQSNPFMPRPGHAVNLSTIDPAHKGDESKDTAQEKIAALQVRLEGLQERLYAERRRALLIVLQGMDTSGKDGTIKRVFEGMSPLGIRIANFKTPTSEELAHDFLWRVHREVPPKGYIGVFNRSHYEDVLIARVNSLVPHDELEARYDHINNFEKLLCDTGTHILKFFLYISKDEQKERLQERLDNPEKHWKFSSGDLPVRARWDDYMRAYEEAIRRCNTDTAPWVIVPANRKWYRDLFILNKIVETLEEMNPQYPAPEPGLDKIVIPD